MTAWESSAPVNCVIRPSFRAVRHGKGTVERDYSVLSCGCEPPETVVDCVAIGAGVAPVRSVA